MPVVPGPLSPAGPSGLGGPCAPWVTAGELDCSTVDEAIREEAVVVATELLWALSGRRYGASCPTTIRPCLRSHCGPRPPAAAFPCSRLGAVLDLGIVVHEVLEVLIDGEEFTEWTLDNHRLLRRTDGYQWPATQDLAAAETEAGTWSVSYTVGADVPVSGKLAARVLACEFATFLAGGKCKLPARLRNVSRQGVSMEVIDPQEFLVDGRLGIFQVDAFLVAVNPHGLAAPSRVMSPDMPRHVVR